MTTPPLASGDNGCSSAVKRRCRSVGLEMVWKITEMPKRAVLEGAKSMSLEECSCGLLLLSLLLLFGEENSNVLPLDVVDSST